MDPSILLQKQLRDNSEDLQSEFLDMKAWEEQMKRKDAQLQNAEEPSFPPIRTKKLIKKVEANKEKETSKCKRIKSYNYDAWNKFDVESACRAVDEEEKITEIVEEIVSPEELEKQHKEALAFKNEGNTFVKQQMWTKAIPCYSKAITVYPGDATFYANRALCHLKIDNLYSAESDCTGAIQLDDSYVKAYHRRATARIGLKQYKEAKQDVEKILKLEPSNKEAVLMLAQINKKLEALKPLVITSSDRSEEVSLEAKIGKKLWGEISESESEDKSKNTVNKKYIANGIPKCTSDVSKNDEQKKEQIETDEMEDNALPAWLPKLKKEVSIVQTVKKFPHQQTQKPIKKIPVQLLGPGESIFDGLTEEIINDNKKVKAKVKETEQVKTKEISNVSNLVQANEPLEIPPEPCTLVQFLFHWNKNKCHDFRYKYLKQIAPEKIPNLFKDSLESSTFSDILAVLKISFIPKNLEVFQFLKSLSQIKRFTALTMFMTKTDREILKDLFQYCEDKEKRSSEEITDLKTKYMK